MKEVKFFTKLPDATGMFEIASFDANATVKVEDNGDGCTITSGSKTITAPRLNAEEVKSAFAAAAPQEGQANVVSLNQGDFTGVQLRRSGVTLTAV
jgi:hypothetical protein